MPIYQNIDGAWRAITLPARVNDAATGGWAPVEKVFAHAQGRWRQIWPNAVVKDVMITVRAIGAEWPDTGGVEVVIEQVRQPKDLGPDPAPLSAPKQGTVTVTSGEWRQEFPAEWGSASYPLPARDAGTYSVGAVWSMDPDVTGWDSYEIAKAPARVVLSSVPPAVVRFGEPYVLYTDVISRGYAAPEGGYTVLRRQEAPHDTMDAWSDARIYTGGQVARTVSPIFTGQWQTALAGHPNLEDALSDPLTIQVLDQSKGYDDVVPVHIRSYSHGGKRVRRQSYDVFHGTFYDADGHSAYGREFGVLWLPPLGAGKSCTGVEVQWHPETTWIDTSLPDRAGTARMALGYHVLPEPPPNSIDPVNDERIVDTLTGIYMTAGRSFWIDCSTSLVPVVNNRPEGGFGLIVGSNLASANYPAWYGSGRALTIRYHWEVWT